MILSTFSHLIEKKPPFLITYNKKASKHQIIYKKTTTRTMTEDNKAIDLYINEEIFSHLLKIQKKENIPILVTIFVNNHYQDQKEIETKLVNNLYFNKN